ncbi:MAG: FeoB-associated Cys-rich membrane protein [Clostridiales bacterium]|nr:FeoB-associated Cys-rich membrane protein [Clostridiales bacterium]
MIPYLLATAIIAWGVYSLVKYFKNRKKRNGCSDCRGCGGNSCTECDRSKK